MLIYVVKVNVILATLCLLAEALMQRDTFLSLRRMMLIAIYVTAFVVPLSDVGMLFSESAAAFQLAEGYATHVLPALTVTASRISWLNSSGSVTAAASWQTLATLLFVAVWMAGSAFLACRLVAQVAYLAWLRLRLPRAEVCGQEVSLLPRSASPFSFYRWIFVHTDGLDEATLRDVVTHEAAHVSGCHTADTLLSELTCIAFWWNPATWVMRREVRMVLEFLADRAVTSSLLATAPSPSDADARTALRAYQLHLLTFSQQQRVATIANNLNVLPLKQRILMMNQKPTHWSSAAKYVLLPVAVAGLVIATGVDAMARHLPLTDPIKPIQVVEVSPLVAPSDTIVNIPEELPVYEGGEGALMQDLARSMRYPAEALEAGVQGRLFVEFVVETNGSVSHVKIARMKDLQGNELRPQAYTREATPAQRAQADTYNKALEALQKESIRVVKHLPKKFQPGRQQGKPVRTRFTLPITFRLN